MAVVVKSVKEMLDERASKFHEYKAIIDRADKEKKGELSAEDRQNLDRLDGELDQLTSDLESQKDDQRRRDRLAELSTKLKQPGERQTGSTQPGSDPDVTTAQGLTMEFKTGVGRPQKLRLKPGTKELLRAQPDYDDKFGQYLQGAGRGEQLGLQVGADSKGGYLAPMQWVSELIKFLDDMVFMRRLCRVISVPGAVSLGAPSWDTDPADADWTAEVPASDLAEDDSARIGKREFTPHLVSKLVKLSRMLLSANTLLDPATLIAERLSYKFSVTEEKGFLIGDGAQKPLGVFTPSNDGIPTSRDTVCASATVFTADELIDCLFSLKEAYQRRATWLVSREFIKRTRKLKDSQNQYLWQPGLQQGAPDRILDRPYVMSEFVPNTFTAGQYTAVVGDFSAYWIVDSLAMEIQRLDELLALRNQVGIIGRKMTDGMPVLGEAFARMRML